MIYSIALCHKVKADALDFKLMIMRKVAANCATVTLWSFRSAASR